MPSLWALMKSVSPLRSRKRPFLFAAGQEPEADGNLRRVEELAGEGDHAIDKVGLDDGPANLAFARLVRRHRAVGKDETGKAGRGEMVNEVLNPGVVGVSGGRGAEFPACVFAEPLAAPNRWS